METALSTLNQTGVVPVQAESDERLIQMWLHSKSTRTKDAYQADIQRFLDFVGVSIRQVRLVDLQAFDDSLAGIADNSRRRVLSAVKSLLTFATKLGYLPFNVGAALPLPSVKDTLAERILPEDVVHRIIALEPDQRNRVLLRFLYASGGRVSEVCSLKWRDLQERGKAGQVTFYGKGGKTRHVPVSVDTWREVSALKNGSGPDEAVFKSRKGGHLVRSQVLRIVQAAAHRAGIEGNVSPHWFRHAHASHSIDRGCPISLVQATLGHARADTTGRYLHARPGDSSALYLGV